VFERLARENVAFPKKNIHKEQITSQDTTMPHGNFPDIFLGIGLWSSYGLYKTLQIDTKSNPQRNQIYVA
jgi:hypothetical protein